MKLQDAATSPVGQPLARVDGRAKVTGTARFAADFPAENLLHAVPVVSTIARGRVRRIDDAAAKAAGARLVVTSANMPRLPRPKRSTPGAMVIGEERPPLSDDVVSHAGQIVALALADTLAAAQHAAHLVRVEYDAEPHALGLDNDSADAGGDLAAPEKSGPWELQHEHGDKVDPVFDWDNVRTVRATFTTPVEHHSPIEPSCTLAWWGARGGLTLRCASRDLVGTRDLIAHAFGVELAQVRVIVDFIGGAFGSKHNCWPDYFLAAAAARLAGRPVRLAYPRHLMFTSAGHRPSTRQDVALAAAMDGKLAALAHDSVARGSRLDDFVEPCGNGTSLVTYATPALRVTHKVRRADVPTPTFMRAPGEVPGMFALECALDELAEQLGVDPLAMRLTNHADTHPANGKPWSTKHLRECYAQAVEKFGWAKRNPTPRSTRDADGRLVGWGMATAPFPAARFPGVRVALRLYADANGVRAVARSAAHEIGQGARTSLAQLAAETVGLPADRVTFELGDSQLPPGANPGGSNSTATTSAALFEAGEALKLELLKLAGAEWQALTTADVALKDGALVAATGTRPLADLVRASGRAYVEATGRSAAGYRDGTVTNADKSVEGDRLAAAAQDVAFHSFGCHFVEVKIDPDTGEVRVTRVVSAADVGRIVNPRLARSQVIGAVVMGIGSALTEATHYCPTTGRPVNADLGEYLLPTCADVPEIDVIFAGGPDERFNPAGVRGLGEIGIVGLNAAIANAVYHATGRRVRSLPITPDKLI